MTKERARRFWDFVDVSLDKTSCWNWNGAHVSRGYGTFSVEGKQQGAHRIAWTLAFGPIPTGLWVLHRCDNPRCVNPHHLFLGTHLDNVEDKTRKHRCRTAQGSDHYLSKVTESEVTDMVHRHAAGETQKKLAEEFGLSRATVCNIVHGKIWKHVTAAIAISKIRHANAKLTEETARNILAASKLGDLNAKSLAEKLHVHPTTIRRIVQGFTWKSIRH